MFTLWVALLSVPMLQGKWLASPWSDQYAAGYAFRAWGAEWWHRLGHVPLCDKRWEGYGLLAVAVALSLLGHFQIAYYLLIAAGVFALYLTLQENPGDAPARRFGRLGLVLGAVLLGFGLAAIQVLPFIHYIPFSPRAQGFHGFEGSTSFAVPCSHVPEFVLKPFAGSRETSWGPAGVKLHSAYLGLPVVALAALGAVASERRRLVLWVGGLGR